MVQDRAKLCLFNMVVTDGAEGAIAVGSASSLVSNATVNVGWAVFRGMQVLLLRITSGASLQYFVNSLTLH